MIGPAIEVDDGGLATWINDAYMYICEEIIKVNPDYFTDDATSNTTAGDGEYDLPDDNEKIVMVNIQYSGVWRRALPLAEGINQVAVLQNSTSRYDVGAPVYYIIGDQIGFLPVPSTNTDLIKIWYVYTPDELALDTDVPEIPKGYHHIIKYGAYANYLDQDDEHTAAENMRNRFEHRVASMVENIADNQVDEPKSVVITQNSDLYMDRDQNI